MLGDARECFVLDLLAEIASTTRSIVCLDNGGVKMQRSYLVLMTIRMQTDVRLLVMYMNRTNQWRAAPQIRIKINGVTIQADFNPSVLACANIAPSSVGSQLSVRIHQRPE